MEPSVNIILHRINRETRVFHNNRGYNTTNTELRKDFTLYGIIFLSLEMPATLMNDFIDHIG